MECPCPFFLCLFDDSFLGCVVYCKKKMVVLCIVKKNGGIVGGRGSFGVGGVMGCGSTSDGRGTGVVGGK